MVRVDRKMYLDVMRIVCTFFVIMLHVSAKNWYYTDINSFEWNVFNVYDSISRWSVPTFVMISGALFLEKDITIEDILKRYICRIIKVFLFWSMLYAVIRYCKGTSLVMTAKIFLTGEYHLWYLFMIAALYLTIPFLKVIVTNNKMIWYFLTLFFLFSCLLPQGISIISIFQPTIGDGLVEINNDMSFHISVGYTGYFLLGYVLDKHMFDKWSLHICVFGLVGSFATIMFTVMLSGYIGEANSLFYSYFSINVLFTAVMMFVLFKKVQITNERIQKIIREVSKATLGIYLLHAMVIDFLDLFFGIDSLSFNPIISVPSLTMLVFVISLFVSYIIRKLPLVKNVI